MNFREVKILGLWLDGANTELLRGGSERAHTHTPDFDSCAAILYQIFPR
jgi:hypothetical protein